MLLITISGSSSPNYVLTMMNASMGSVMSIVDSIHPIKASHTGRIAGPPPGHVDGRVTSHLTSRVL
jgi:hypothetical protein